MDWILDHIDAILALIAAAIGAWKAKQNGNLNTFLVKKVEGLATQGEKDAIKADAIGAGVQGVLGKVVTNAGLSSKEKPAGLAKKALQTVLPLLLGAALLGGCKSTEPYRLSLGGVVDTSRTVNRELIKSPLTPGEQALLDASNYQLDAAQKLVDAGK